MYLAHPAPFILRKVDVSLELRRLDNHSQLASQVLDEAVDEMMRGAVAAVDERVSAGDFLHVRARCESGDVGIVFPKRACAGLNIGLKHVGIAEMQIAHCGGQHDDITRRQGVFEKDRAHVVIYAWHTSRPKHE